jgi:bacillithiol biosynthesis deacetylase BshB1
MAVDVLAIGAHPDDAEIGCAGFLLKAKARGLRTGIIVLTQGEMGSFGDRESRIHEAEAAAEILKADVFRILDMPDAGLEFNRENTLRITEILKELQPRMLLTPHFDDNHPDHHVVPQLVERASYLATRQSLFPEYEPLIPQPGCLSYPLSFQRTHRLDFVLDITDVYGTKQKALQAHSSQYTPLLFAVEIAARYFGMMIPAAYGEGFIHNGPMILNSELAII